MHISSMATLGVLVDKNGNQLTKNKSAFKRVQGSTKSKYKSTRTNDPNVDVKWLIDTNRRDAGRAEDKENVWEVTDRRDEMKQRVRDRVSPNSSVQGVENRLITIQNRIAEMAAPAVQTIDKQPAANKSSIYQGPLRRIKDKPDRNTHGPHPDRMMSGKYRSQSIIKRGPKTKMSQSAVDRLNKLNSGQGRSKGSKKNYESTWKDKALIKARSVILNRQLLPDPCCREALYLFSRYINSVMQAPGDANQVCAACMFYAINEMEVDYGRSLKVNKGKWRPVSRRDVSPGATRVFILVGAPKNNRWCLMEAPRIGTDMRENRQRRIKRENDRKRMRKQISKKSSRNLGAPVYY